MDLQKRKLSVKHCPECKKRTLMLKQINVDSAVYLCKDKKCQYPKGHKWIMVDRTLQEMLHDNRQYEIWKKRRQTTKIDKLVETVCNEIKMVSSDSTQSNQLFEAQTSNIDHLLNEEIDKLQNDTSYIPSFDFDTFFGETSDCNESISNNVKSDESHVESSSCKESRTSNLDENLENNKKCDILLNNSLGIFSNNNDLSKVEVYDKTLTDVGNKFNANGGKNSINNLDLNSKCKVEKCVVTNAVKNSSDSKVITNTKNQNVKLLIKNSCNASLVKKVGTKNEPLILNHYILNKPMFR